MKRDRLMWIAAGAAFSAAISFGAAQLIPAPPEQKWILYVAEKHRSMGGKEEDAKWRGAEIARDCGAKSFQSKVGLGSHDSDRTEIPLSTENNLSLNCIVEEARKGGLWIGVGMSIDQ